MDEPVWVNVCSNEIQPKSRARGISRIMILPNCLLSFCNRNNVKKNTVLTSPEMATGIFDYALNRCEMLKISWFSLNCWSAWKHLSFDACDFNVIASVPEEVLPEKLRTFILANYAQMGFLDEWREEWTEEDLAEVRKLIEKYPVLENVISFENGLTTYVNAAGYIDWK